MYKFTCMLWLVLLITVNNISAQTLKENKVDEFTKNTVKRTSWEPISKTGKIYAHVRASKINDNTYLDIRTLFPAVEVFAIKEGEAVMIKLNTDSIITLTIPKGLVSCKGCGSVNIIGSDGYGVELNLELNKEQIESLAKNKVTKIRIYTTDGFVESAIKEKFQETINRVLKLIK